MTKLKATVVTSDEYVRSIGALPKIQALVDALRGTDKQALSYNESTYATVREFEKKILSIHEGYKNVIGQGDMQYENRDQKLIGLAAARVNKIPSDINLLEVTFKAKTRAREAKVSELLKKGFSHAEIDKITPPIPSVEHDQLTAKVKALRNESAQLMAFTNNKPEFNTELLKGTAVYPGNAVEALK